MTGQPKDKKPTKQDKRAEALRANLLKRKQQGRARDAAENADSKETK